MNTIRSTWLGWGTFILAGAGAYYFAKRGVNADRAERHQKYLERQQIQTSLEQSDMKHATPPAGKPRGPDFAGSPSQEASTDPAPTRHAPENDAQRAREKSKYEASEPYRSKKGNRLT